MICQRGAAEPQNAAIIIADVAVLTMQCLRCERAKDKSAVTFHRITDQYSLVFLYLPRTHILQWSVTRTRSKALAQAHDGGAVLACETKRTKRRIREARDKGEAERTRPSIITQNKNEGETGECDNFVGFQATLSIARLKIWRAVTSSRLGEPKRCANQSSKLLRRAKPKRECESYSSEYVHHMLQ